MNRIASEPIEKLPAETVEQAQARLAAMPFLNGAVLTDNSVPPVPQRAPRRDKGVPRKPTPEPAVAGKLSANEVSKLMELIANVTLTSREMDNAVFRKSLAQNALQDYLDELKGGA
jgi:hypothetical protein